MLNEYIGNGRRICHSKHFLTVTAARAWVNQLNANPDLGAIEEVAAVPYPEAVQEFFTGCYSKRVSLLVPRGARLEWIVVFAAR